jgi:NADH-quinone oxidoreductase subunit L
MNPFLLGCLVLTWMLPLAASLIVLLFWQSNLKQNVGFLSWGLSVVGLLACLPLIDAFGLGAAPFIHAKSWPWIDLVGGPLIEIGFLIDRTGSQLLGLLALLGSLIQFFSLKYMKSEANPIKYYAALNLFIFSMNSLILSNGLLQAFAAWELIGLSSWLLIGYWSDTAAAASGSLRAMLFNRLADVALLAGLLLAAIESGTSTWTGLLADSEFKLSVFPALLIVLGAAGKSAQGPFACWLPGAMAGPTPVSALLHAATLVVAGVFLLVRAMPVLPEPALLLTALLGCSTLIGGSLYALQSRDIKQILAGSTLSQLGLMFVALGTGEAQWAFLHLLTHGFYKFGLFLVVAVVSKPLHHEPNPYAVEHYGGWASRRPALFAVYLACALGLIGFPLTAGFVSKELVLESILQQTGTAWGIMQVLTLASVALTAAYISRHAYFIFLKKPEQGHKFITPAIPFYYSVPMAIVFLGCLYFWLTPLNPFGFGGLTLVDAATEVPHVHGWHTFAILLLSAGSVSFSLYVLRKDSDLMPDLKLFHKKYLKQFETFLWNSTSLIQYLETAIVWLTVVQPVRLIAGLRVGSGPERPVDTSVVGLVRWIEHQIRFLFESTLPALLRLVNSPIQQVSSASFQTYVAASMVGLLLILYFIL